MSYQRRHVNLRDTIVEIREAARIREGERYLQHNPVTGLYYRVIRLGGAGSDDWWTVGGPVNRNVGERWRAGR